MVTNFNSVIITGSASKMLIKILNSIWHLSFLLLQARPCVNLQSTWQERPSTPGNSETTAASGPLGRRKGRCSHVEEALPPINYWGTWHTCISHRQGTLAAQSGPAQAHCCLGAVFHGPRHLLRVWLAPALATSHMLSCSLCSPRG